MLRPRLKVWLAALLMLGSLRAAIAQAPPVPSLMNFQGRLARPDGTPVPNGTHVLVFTLFDAVTGGTSKWSESQSVSVRNSVFAALLGGTSPLNETVFAADRWMEITVDGVKLTPRQKVVSNAFAFKANLALTVPDGSLTAAKIANGTITADKLAANTLNPLAWLLNGNSAVTSGFLGTTDNQPLTFKVNSRRAMFYQYAENVTDPNNTYRSINVLGGSGSNGFGLGVVGATIAGGGYDTFTTTSYPNQVLADFGTISGGYGHKTNGRYATIGGGVFNISTGDYSAIGGGSVNAASATATVGGGSRNTARGESSIIGGGDSNTTSQYATTISGGYGNTASGGYAAVAGGSGNTASGLASTVVGGWRNTAGGRYSFVAGRKAQALFDGSFVWADQGNPTNGTDFADTGQNQFLVRATGGVGINTNAPQQAVSIVGGLNLDQGNSNNGTFTNDTTQPALHFGSGSGEGIASKRTSGGNVAGLDFYTAFANRLSITNSGNIGIGTSAPATALDVRGLISTNKGVQSGSGAVATNDLGLYSLNAGNWLRLVSNNAPIQFFTNSAQGTAGSPTIVDFTINTNGNATLRGTLTQNSDGRWKKNVATFDNALDAILNLRGVTYEWKEADREAGRQIGFIAQEVEKILPELVSTDSRGYKSVAYANVVPVLVEAMKTQNRKVETLSKENAELWAKNAAMEVRLAAIEQVLAELKTTRK